MLGQMMNPRTNASLRQFSTQDPGSFKMNAPAQVFGQMVTSLSRNDLENLPVPELFSLSTLLKGWYRQQLYCKILLQSGTTLAKDSEFEAFAFGIGDPYFVWNTGGNAGKARTDITTMQNGGFLPAGHAYIASGMMCRILTPPAAATTYELVNGVWTGRISNTADSGAQPAGYNQTQYTQALSEQIVATLRFNRKDSNVDGRLCDFPADKGLSASYGNQATERLVQNFTGVGAVKNFDRAILFPTLQAWDVLVKNNADLAIPVNTIIEIAFDGWEVHSNDYNALGSPI